MSEEAEAVVGGGGGGTPCAVSLHEFLVGEDGLAREGLSHFRGEFRGGSERSSDSPEGAQQASGPIGTCGFMSL